MLQITKICISSANFSEREFLSLTDSLNKENIFLPESDIHNLATMNIMLYRGMLETLREDSEYLSIEEATADNCFVYPQSAYIL